VEVVEVVAEEEVEEVEAVGDVEGGEGIRIIVFYGCSCACSVSGSTCVV